MNAARASPAPPLEHEFLDSQRPARLGQMRRNHAFASALSLALIPIMELAALDDAGFRLVRPTMLGLAVAQATYLGMTWTPWLQASDRVRVQLSFVLRVVYKFVYDVWGDAVNTASRMESHGVPGAIQTTETVYLRLRDRFRFDPRGTIPVKGKGELRTYFLTGRGP